MPMELLISNRQTRRMDTPNTKTMENTVVSTAVSNTVFTSRTASGNEKANAGSDLLAGPSARFNRTSPLDVVEIRNQFNMTVHLFG